MSSLHFWLYFKTTFILLTFAKHISTIIYPGDALCPLWYPESPICTDMHRDIRSCSFLLKKKMFLSPVGFSESTTQYRRFAISQISKAHCVSSVFTYGTKGKGGRYNTNVHVAIYQLVFHLFHTPVMRCWGRCWSHNSNQHQHVLFALSSPLC